MTEYLNFLNTTVQFEVASDAEAPFAAIRSFFRHHIGSAAAGDVNFKVSVKSYAPGSDVDSNVWDSELQVVRKSSTPEFTFYAHILKRNDRKLYVNRSMLLDSPRDARDDSCFEMHITRDAKIQAIDFIRDLVIRHEEVCGSVVLHASAIQDPNGAVAIAGAKGSGKTTTLLAALRQSGWSYFSGDKLFCELVNGGLWVHPWRDYPYVGVGTILTDPDLTRLVREVDAKIDLKAPTDKVLLDPEVFEEWIGCEFTPEPKRLNSILLPAIQADRQLYERIVTDENERWALLNKIIDRQSDTTFFTWQSYLVPDYSAFFSTLSKTRVLFDDIPMIELPGNPDLDHQNVLRDILGRTSTRGDVGVQA